MVRREPYAKGKTHMALKRELQILHRVSPEEKQQLHDLAEQMDMSMSQVLRLAVRQLASSQTDLR